MKQTTSSSFLFTGFTGAGAGAAPSLFFGGLPLFLFTGAAAAGGGCCWGGCGCGAAAPMIDPRNCWSSKPSPWRGGDGSLFVAAAGGVGCGCRCRCGAALRAGGGGGSGTGGGGGRRSSGGHSASPGESTSAPGPVPASMDQQPHPRLASPKNPNPSSSSLHARSKACLVVSPRGLSSHGPENEVVGVRLRAVGRQRERDDDTASERGRGGSSKWEGRGGKRATWRASVNRGWEATFPSKNRGGLGGFWVRERGAPAR
jgi:hypothetical protein